jgi:hypothetical protein
VVHGGEAAFFKEEPVYTFMKDVVPPQFNLQLDDTNAL